MEKSLEAIKYSRGHLLVLNQLLLPRSSQYDVIGTIEDAWSCIREMRVIKPPM